MKNSSKSIGDKFEKRVQNVLEAYDFHRVTIAESTSSEAYKKKLKGIPDNSFVCEKTNNKVQQIDFIVKYKKKFFLIEARNRKTFQWRNWTEEAIGQSKTAQVEKGIKFEKIVLVYGEECPELPDTVKDSVAKTKIHFVHGGMLDHLLRYSSVRPRDFRLRIGMSHFLGEKDKESEKISFVAQRLRQNDIDVYTLGSTTSHLEFLVDVHTLKKISTGYQRFYDENRLKHIKSFIESGRGFWANSVMFGARDADVTFSKFAGNHGEAENAVNNAQLGILSISNVPGAIKIVDGQHRFYGTAQSKLRDSLELPMTLVVFPSDDEEAVSFLKVNSKQVKLAPKHLLKLYSRKKIGDLIESTEKDPKKKMEERARAWAGMILEKVSDELFGDGALVQTNAWTKIGKMLNKGVIPQHLALVQGSDSDRDINFKKTYTDYKVFFKACQNAQVFEDGRLLYSTGIEVLLITFPEIYKKFSEKYSPGSSGVHRSLKQQSVDEIVSAWKQLPWNEFKRRAFLGSGGAKAFSDVLLKSLAGGKVSPAEMGKNFR